MPVYYVDIPVSKLKVNILKRRINKEYLADFSERVYVSGIKYPNSIFPDAFDAAFKNSKDLGSFTEGKNPGVNNQTISLAKTF